jgi:hypothetical protein
MTAVPGPRATTSRIRGSGSPWRAWRALSRTSTNRAMSNANVVRVTRLAMKERSDVDRADVALNERDDTRAIKITTGAAVGTHQCWRSVLMKNRDVPSVCATRPLVELGPTIASLSGLDVNVYE